MNHHEMFERIIYGKWSVQTSKQAYTRTQCSHASAGLAQLCLQMISIK